MGEDAGKFGVEEGNHNLLSSRRRNSVLRLRGTSEEGVVGTAALWNGEKSQVRVSNRAAKCREFS